MERFLTFRAPHRLRYTGEDGTVAYDGVVQVKYEFTTVDSSVQFQGGIRGKTLLDYYDVDVVWSDVNSRTDRFGSVRGMGMVQRLKLWRDNYSNLHSITVFANRSSRQYHEYEVHWFESEFRSRDDRGKQMRLNVRGRRSSSSDVGRRFSFNRMRPRQRSAPNVGHGESSQAAAAAAASGLDIRYLGIQFSSRNGELMNTFLTIPVAMPKLLSSSAVGWIFKHLIYLGTVLTSSLLCTTDYRQFLEAWAQAHDSDRQFRGVPFPHHRVELESPQIHANAAELDAGLHPVLEPESEDE